jgi:hypothetical protein
MASIIPHVCKIWGYAIAEEMIIVLWIYFACQHISRLKESGERAGYTVDLGVLNNGTSIVSRMECRVCPLFVRLGCCSLHPFVEYQAE